MTDIRPTEADLELARRILDRLLVEFPESDAEELAAVIAADFARRTEALAKDKARLDYLEANLQNLSRLSQQMGGQIWCGKINQPAGGPWTMRIYHRTIREAIDAAIAPKLPKL